MTKNWYMNNTRYIRDNNAEINAAICSAAALSILAGILMYYIFPSNVQKNKPSQTIEQKTQQQEAGLAKIIK